MKQNPPIIPKYLQVGPKDPSGMKKAPTMPPITSRNFMAQKLKFHNTLGNWPIIIIKMISITIVAITITKN